MATEPKKDQITDVAAAGAAVTTTTVTPAKADETSNPGLQDASPNDPPVRTNRPDVPIAQTLAAGAGAHEGRVIDHIVVEADGTEVEVDADGIDRDGRFHAGTVKKSK